MANCLATKKSQSSSIGNIEVLIFLMTTNLIIVPVTKIAIKSLINQASVKTNMSIAMTKAPKNKAILQIMRGLSEQQENRSEKQRQMSTIEKTIAAQYVPSVVSSKQVLTQTVAKRNTGYKTANKQPKRIGDILLYFMLVQRKNNTANATNCVRITASKGRQMPQLQSSCSSLSTKYTTLAYPSPLHCSSWLISLIQIFSVISVSPSWK